MTRRESLAWNSAALENRDDIEALQVEDQFLGGSGSILREGKNVLAIQGLTTSLNDATGLFEVQLIGVDSPADAAALVVEHLTNRTRSHRSRLRKTSLRRSRAP